MRIVKLCRALPRKREGRVFGDQLLRCGTAVAANYRAACRSRSKAEFASRIAIVLEEADETAFWLEVLADAETLKASRLQPLHDQEDELVRIFAAARNTTQQQTRNQKSAIRNGGGAES